MERLEKPEQFNAPTLVKYGTDLTKMAEEGKLDPLVGREKQVECVTQILCKRRKNNACLIGEPGVGKTVIAEGLALAIVQATAPLKLQKCKVFSLDMGRLIAGTMYRGQLEERLTKIVEEVDKSKGSIILFIDEVHTLIYTGEAADILKPALARGVLKCIGATTLKEYREYIEKDPALNRRFQTVQVPEPTVDETIQILRGTCKKYESFHNVRYEEEALVAAARLSKQYIRDRFLPDKAIDLIDEAGSRVQLQQTEETSTETPTVTKADIEHLISSWTGIPIEKLSESETKRLLDMEEVLHKCVIGQHKAVEAVSRAIRRARVGIRDTRRPLASFLFTGPSGVGKTELAKALAAEYFGSEESIIRLDMSEYSERHTVSRLVGSPPGYIGHDEGGQLTEPVRRKPFSLILFDEIEKAHIDIFNVMLQLLDDGRLTDGRGQTIDFTNTLVILTSNIGDHLIVEGSRLGFDQVKMEVAQELKRNFRPEFLNRIDEVVVFEKLDSVQLQKIMDIMLEEICQRLGEKNFFLKVTDEFKEKLLKEGSNPSYGARPLRRTIVRLLEDTLAEKILRGDIKEGDTIAVGLDRKGDVLLF